MEKTTNVKSQSTDLVDNNSLLINGSNELSDIDSYYFHRNGIERCVNRIRDDFFELGKGLFEMKDSKTYLIGGYKDVYEFAKGEFSIESTSTKNFINIYENFKNKDNYLDDKFKAFSLTQLVEILPLADDKDFCSQLSDLTVKEIREVKKITRFELLESKWEPLSLVLKEIIENILDKLGIKYNFINPVKQDEEDCSEEFKSLNYDFGDFGSLEVSLKRMYWTDTKYQIECEICDDVSCIKSAEIEFKNFKKDFKKFVTNSFDYIKEAKAAETKELSKAAVIVDSEVVDGSEMKESSKMPTLRNDAARLEFVENIKNWKFLGTIVDDSPVVNVSDMKNGFRLVTYKFKIYPKFVKIAIGHPSVSDEFKNCGLYEIYGTGENLHLTSVSENTIVNLLRADKY
jgi:hypothetical protein